MNTLSIQSDLLSDVIQQNLCYSSNRLNKALQRISTGFKINSASDDAANCTVSTKINTKISGLNVANNNINIAVSTLSTISSNYDQITNQLQNLRDLAIQASSGTYSSTDCQAINEESSKLINEINREISKTNSILPTSEMATGFSSNVEQITEADAIIQGYDEDHIIHNASEFVSKIQADNYGDYILTNDIDMSELGTFSTSVISHYFGLLDGNGHTIKNLTIDAGSSDDYIGLFGSLINGSENSGIKNLGLENVIINAQNSSQVGGLAGDAYGCSITNCHVSGNITGGNEVGGLIGSITDGEISNSYSKGNVLATEGTVGGLLGHCYGNSISNAYSSANVVSQDSYAGGLSGDLINSTLTNVSATGNISGTDGVGGLSGQIDSSNIANSYAKGNVTGSDDNIGGLAGNIASGTITNSYATGNCTGWGHIGGLVGFAAGVDITNSYAKGNSIGESSYIGGLIGFSAGGSVTNSYAIGDASGEGGGIGGLVGSSSATITNSYASGDAKGEGMFVGGLTGSSYGSITSSYATGAVISAADPSFAGGLVGANDGEITYSYSTGLVLGNSDTGGFAGTLFGGNIDNSNYWDSETSGMNTSAGDAQGVTTEELAKIIAQMKRENIGIDPNETVGYKSAPSNSITTQTGTETTNTYKVENLTINIDLSGIDLTTNQKAKDSIDITDQALYTISMQNMSLGSNIKILDSLVDINTNQSNLLTQTNSTIKDADIAEEVAELTKQQILQQTNANLLKENNSRRQDILLNLINKINPT